MEPTVEGFQNLRSPPKTVHACDILVETLWIVLNSKGLLTLASSHKFLFPINLPNDNIKQDTTQQCMYSWELKL